MFPATGWWCPTWNQVFKATKQSSKTDAILFAIISDQDVVNQRLQLITLDVKYVFRTYRISSFLLEKRATESADIKPLKLRLNAVGLQCFVLTSKLEHVV